MKKVGILTFHRALNYGAKLQAYALMETLNEKCDAYILDYRCQEIENFYFYKIGIKDVAKKILFPRYCNALAKRKRKFQEFNKYYKLSDTYSAENIVESNNIFDAFVVGSDQVWNPAITGYDYNFFLQFADVGKLYTYGISFGKARISDWDKEKIYILLKKFENLLTREKTGAKMLRQFNSSFSAFHVLDPVFLLTREQWINKLGLAVTEHKEKYIVVYIVAAQTNALERAKKIASERNWKVLFIDSGRKEDAFFEKVNDVGPVEFLNLILNAEMVITTSFHALAFSIIFNIPFQYELSKEKINANSRLTDLTRELDVNKYEIYDVVSEINENYNWNTVNRNVNLLRNKSKEFLFDLLIDD